MAIRKKPAEIGTDSTGPRKSLSSSAGILIEQSTGRLVRRVKATTKKSAKVAKKAVAKKIPKKATAKKRPAAVKKVVAKQASAKSPKVSQRKAMKMLKKKVAAKRPSARKKA